MHSTLSPQTIVGDSVLGTVLFGRRGWQVTASQNIPFLRSKEDAEAFYYSPGLDPSLPVEVNSVALDSILKRIAKLDATGLVDRPHMDSTMMFRGRPSIASVPAEYLCRPAASAVRSLRKKGDASKKIAELRIGEVDLDAREEGPDGKPRYVTKAGDLRSDADFWAHVAQQGAYLPWVREQAARAWRAGCALFAPPTPVVHARLASSAEQQAVANEAVDVHWSQTPHKDEMGLMYNLPIHASAFSHAELVMETVNRALRATQDPNNHFYGVRMEILDMEQVTNSPTRVSMAKALAGHLAKELRNRNRQFALLSDVGACGPAFLDAGAALSTFHPGLTTRRQHADGGNFEDETQTWGKLLLKWEYNLVGKRDLETRQWKVQPNSLFPGNEVPAEARGMTAPAYRIHYAKPSNMSTIEDLNAEREKALRAGERGPGSQLLGRSNDDSIAPWH